MPTTNFFFNTTSFTSEQNLLSDLSTEMIKIFGVDIVYLPRTTPNIDKIFFEDPTSKFTNAVTIEMYIKDFDGYRGEGDMMTKFGISMDDQITFCVSRTRFQEEIGAPYNLIRPREGDLLYFGIPNAIFEIKFVEHEAVYYQTGGLQFFELRCQRFNYSNEEFDTGNDIIDEIEKTYSDSTLGDRLTNDSNELLLSDDVGNIIIETAEPDQKDSTAQNALLGGEDISISFVAVNPFRGK